MTASASLPIVGALLLALSSAMMNAGPEPNSGADQVAAEKRLRAKVAKISARRTAEQVRAEIAAWKQREPNSPEPYIVSASYELELSRQPMEVYETATGKNKAHPGKDGATEYPIVDKAGQQVGVLGAVPVGPKPDAATAKRQQLKAAAELEEALKKFPNRLDMMIGRCIALGEAHAWEPLAIQMESALQRAATDPESLRMLEDQKPSTSPADNLLGGLQGFINNAFAAGDRDAGRRLAELGLKYFPNTAPLLCDLGGLYLGAGDWQQALPYFERAEKVAPQDGVVLWNLCQTYLQAQRWDDAREIANRIVQSHPDLSLELAARDIVRRLNNQAPPGRR